MSSSPESPSIERRHHQRVVFNGTATLQVQSTEMPVRTRNVSVGGISVLASHEVPTDTGCIVHVAIPDGDGEKRVALQARVVNSTFNKIEGGFMVSLQFIKLSANVAATIARFMKSR